MNIIIYTSKKLENKIKLRIKSEKGAFNLEEILNISSRNRFKEIEVDVEKITLNFKCENNSNEEGIHSIF
jgi:hypothetical protein